jgi:cell wall-associated NlpC family hydrolase
MMNGNEALNKAAKRLIGSRYKPHGRTPEEGLDCYGVAILLLREIGVDMPDVFYPDTEQETNHRVLESMKCSIPNVKLEKPEPGCIIEFSVFGEPAHIGVYLGVDGGLFIHASRNYGVCAEMLSRWRQRVVGYYRVVSE